MIHKEVFTKEIRKLDKNWYSKTIIEKIELIEKVHNSARIITILPENNDYGYGHYVTVECTKNQSKNVFYITNEMLKELTGLQLTNPKDIPWELSK